MIGCHYTADIKSRSGAALNDLQLLFHSVSTFSKLFSKKKIKKNQIWNISNTKFIFGLLVISVIILDMTLFRYKFL